MSVDLNGRDSVRPALRILGIRGVPAAHGGFETFAEHLALFLVQRGWRVIVYCQEDGEGTIVEDSWRGVERVRIPVKRQGPGGTIVFDWQATAHAKRFRDPCLTLGYNTAIFGLVLRLKGISNVINMDGIEWARAKWGGAAKTWFWLNDWAGCWLGDHLVADHPEIKRHLESRVSSRKITMIPYGADCVDSADPSLVRGLELTPGRFLTLIARPEPENSVLDMVRAFSGKRRGVNLAVLGNYDYINNPYHRAVREAASEEVLFLGAIYDKRVVQALRHHSMAYVHGHRVGGTNPSLVEAMGAGNAVLAHDNKYNRWVAGEAALYFASEEQFSERLESLITLDATRLEMSRASRSRFEEMFTWPRVLAAYERLLSGFIGGTARVPEPARIP